MKVAGPRSVHGQCPATASSGNQAIKHCYGTAHRDDLQLQRCLQWGLTAGDVAIQCQSSLILQSQEVESMPHSTVSIAVGQLTDSVRLQHCLQRWPCCWRRCQIMCLSQIYPATTSSHALSPMVGQPQVAMPHSVQNQTCPATSSNSKHAASTTMEQRKPGIVPLPSALAHYGVDCLRLALPRT